MLYDPAKPRQNGADEIFNGKLVDEHLRVESFCSRRRETQNKNRLRAGFPSR